jgi:HEAT repeat protein
MRKPILVASAFAVLVGGYVVSQHFRRTSAMEQAHDDAVVAQEVSSEFRRQLAELAPEHPIRQRFGKFVELRDAGHLRHQGFAMGPHLTLSGTAVFEKANVPCSGVVNVHGPLSVTIRMTPSQEWMDKNPTASLRKSGDVFVVSKPGMTSATSLEYGAAHPNFFNDRSEKRHSKKVGRSVNQAIAMLGNEVASAESSDVPETRQWYQSQRRAEAIDRFLIKAFQDSSLNVRLEAAKLLALPSPGYGKVSHADSTIELLLDEVDDQQQNPSVRAAIVSALLLNYEDKRKGLYERLHQMGPDAHVYVPVIASFLGDSSARHRSDAGAFDAPVGAVKLLGDWGPASADAVPALIDALKNHPNQWTFAAAVAEALGEIGSDAKDAIPELILASSSSHDNLRAAATDAIGKLHTGGKLPMNYDVTNETDIEHLGAKFMQGNSYRWAIDPDGKRIWSIVNKDGLSGLYEIGMEDLVYKRVASISTDGLAGVHVTSECVVILRINREDDAPSVVVDRWSKELGKKLDRVVLFRIDAIPEKSRVSLRNVVWTQDGHKVAFVQCESEPVAGRPRMSRQSNRLKAFNTQTGQSLVVGKVSEYQMKPIAFAAHQDSINFYGHCFETGNRCLAEFDLSTKLFRPIDNTALSGYVAIRVHNNLVVYQGTGSKPAPIKLLNLQSGLITDLVFDADAPRLYDPFHYLLSFIDDETVSVVMETTIDIFDAMDGKRLHQIPIFQPKGRRTIRPVLYASTRDQVILLASNGFGSSNSLEGLWVRQIDHAALDR